MQHTHKIVPSSRLAGEKVGFRNQGGEDSSRTATNHRDFCEAPLLNELMGVFWEEESRGVLRRNVLFLNASIIKLVRLLTRTGPNVDGYGSGADMLLGRE